MVLHPVSGLLLDQPVEAGSKVVSTHTWRWMLGKRFITLRIQEEINGKVVSTGEEILGKDQSTGALAQWFIGSTGIHGAGTWRRNGDTRELKWRGFALGGKTYEGISDHVQIQPDGYTWQMRDMTENGKRIPDWPKVTYSRKAAAAPGEDELWRAFDRGRRDLGRHCGRRPQLRIGRDLQRR